MPTPQKELRVSQFNVSWVLTDSEYALKVSEGMPPDWPQEAFEVHGARWSAYSIPTKSRTSR